MLATGPIPVCDLGDWFRRITALAGCVLGIMVGGLTVEPADIALFHALNAAQIQAASVIRQYTAGEFAFNQGEPTTGLWVVLSGRIAVERAGPDGMVYTTGIWQPGEIIGIAGLWEGSDYPASARALDTPTTVLWMSRDHFLRLHSAIPEFAETVSRILAERLRYVQEAVADTRGRPAAVQVAVVLVTLSRRLGPDLALTHEDLAHMTAVKRETVTRILSDFHERGWVEVRYGHVTVQEPERLKDYAARIN
jgi:CRP-like cAMP-binding protein